MKKFSENLKEIRTQKNVKQTDLAEVCGLSVRQIIRYEQGTSEPTLSILIKMADFFNISLDDLCGHNKEK